MSAAGAKALFWAAVAILAYTIAVFPVVVVTRGILRPRPVRVVEKPLPTVTVIVPAHNEGSAIARKLENLLAVDYPRDRYEVIVASDGSGDDTVDVARRFHAQKVGVLDLPRLGKASTLAAAVAASSGEVLVFTDANSVFASDALRQLVAPYSDADVGGVAGNQVYETNGGDSRRDAGERAYWGFDRVLKEYEGRAGHTISATGAIYTIRRELFRPIPPGVNDDFYLSLGVIEQGRRLAFAGRAVAFEPPGATLDVEFTRKVRVLTRAFTCVIRLRALFDIRHFGFYSVQLFSHKVLRWAMVVPVGTIAISSVALARTGRLYRFAAIVQVGGYSAAIAGVALRSRPIGSYRVLSVPAYFLMANVASAVAAWNVLRGRSVDLWTPARAESDRRALAAAHDGGLGSDITRSMRDC